MQYRPIFQVTQVKNVQRASRANEYTGGGEKEDLWRVRMAHGYYAGMGMDLFFLREAEASEFSLWTIWTPTQLITSLGDEKYQVESVKKIKRMTVPGQYALQRRLVDSWVVSFEGDKSTTSIDMQHPGEGTARAYRSGKSYTAADLFGTLPAIPRDVAYLLEETARRNQDNPDPPPPPEPPAEPPPEPPTPQPTLASRQANAVFRWYTIAPGQAASAYYAEGNPQVIPEGTVYSAVTNPYVKGPYIYFPQGGTLSGFFFPENRDANNTFFGCVVLA